MTVGRIAPAIMSGPSRSRWMKNTGSCMSR
jgi:hypothetical protein